MFWIQSSILILTFLEPIISQHSSTSHEYHPNDQYSVEQNRQNPHRQQRQQRQPNTQLESQRNSEHSRNFKVDTAHQSQRQSQSQSSIDQSMDDLMKKIFNFGNEGGPVIFNYKKRDESLEEEFTFPVQRNPDGKLNVVFTKPSVNRTFIRSPSMKPMPNKGFIFPDERNKETVKAQSDNNDGVATPLCKKEVNKPFCTEVENYPAEQIEQILKQQSTKFEALFGDDLVPESFQNISQRIDPGEDALCESVEKLIHPKAGETMSNKKLIIVNQDNYKQGVRVEECTNPGKKCRMSEFFPNGHVTECKQKYIFRQMVAMDENKNIVKELFKLPSCCICVTWTQRF